MDDILMHRLAVKLGRQNVADIIGIADIQKRIMDHHYR